MKSVEQIQDRIKSLNLCMATAEVMAKSPSVTRLDREHWSKVVHERKAQIDLLTWVVGKEQA